MRWLKEQFFGRSTRRTSDISADQKMLFNETEVLAAIDAADAAHAARVINVDASAAPVSPTLSRNSPTEVLRSRVDVGVESWD